MKREEKRREGTGEKLGKEKNVGRTLKSSPSWFNSWGHRVQRGSKYHRAFVMHKALS